MSRSFLDETFTLKDANILITGASSGFGEHFARVFAKGGCKSLALLARRTDRLEKLAQELKQEHPKLIVVTATCDVAKTGDISKAFDEAEKKSGVIFNVIVNNAGVGPVIKALDETEQTYNQVMDINVRGCFFVAQEAAKRMIQNKVTTGGSIINISSIFGLRVGVGHATYSMSKAALTHMTKALAIEFIRHGIRVNSLNPGFFRTELTQDFYDSPKGDAYLKKHVPIQRLGEYDELDGALLLLASPASKFMYGSVITVDGGHVISSL